MKFWKKYRGWIIALAVIAVMVTIGTLRNAVDPHAGHDHETDPHTEQTQSGDPHEGHDHSNYKVENSYTISTNNNNRHTIQVKDAHGQVIYSRQGLTDKPTCTKVNDSVLKVEDNTSSLSGHWVVLCDVMNSKSSDVFTGCLATKGTYVAYATSENNTWTVHVQNALDKNAAAQTYTLEGAASPDGREVISKAELNDLGDLNITYWAGTESKTTNISLPQA